VVSADGIVKHVEAWQTPPNNTPELEPYWLKDAHAAYVRAIEKRNNESGYADAVAVDFTGQVCSDR
jgi:hypothetical protein